ncbi:MAG: hypothetical protein OXL41_09310 [Nitrospinae bacterium]|nr:hypothetical protein [Nitrospinota bacterium]
MEMLAGSELKDSLTSFFSAVSGVLNGDSNLSSASINSNFDGFDALIVDNNLTGLGLDSARLTAETIIGYLRAFTDAPYIISLNKNPHVDFDLRYLFGDYQSLADLALNTQHLSNSRLWMQKSGEGFSPWYWPLVADAALRRREQFEFIAENLERPVWETLNFPPEADDYLSLRAKSPLSSTEGNPREASFEVFCESSRVLPPAEIKKLRELAARESEFATKAVRQISAYEVDRWLRRDVLGTQDVLIDLPHLVVQMPFLLGERGGDLASWNEVAKQKEPPFGLDAALFKTHLESALFYHTMWAPGPCFWWPSLKSNEQLAERFFAATGDWPDAVFCEDVSRFVHVTGSGETDSPQEFEAEVEGSWTRRYIAVVEECVYSPRSRILRSTA